MRGREFRARDKKVQKLGRDGLVEQNKATGEERRVSQRTADVSFGPERARDQQLGRQTPKKSKKRPIRADLQSRVPEMDQPTAHAENLDTPEGTPLEVRGTAEPAEPDTPPVIRDTRDIPIPPPGRAAGRRTRYARDGPARDSPATESPTARQRAPSDHPTPKRWQEAQQHIAAPTPEAAPSQQPSPPGHPDLPHGPLACPAPASVTADRT